MGYTTMYVNEDECKAAGVDAKEVKRIAKGLSRYARQAEKLGINIFGGSGTGSLRSEDGESRKLVLAYLDGDFGGGDGGTSRGLDGLERGES